MERLKGKTILIGKEPGQGRLLVAITGGKAAAIGAAGSVPNSVSRCKAAEGIAHAKITIGTDGNMTLTNMKPQNCTFVNGTEIVSKRITANTTVELGKDRFRISIPVVIETARKIAGAVSANDIKKQQETKEVNIKPLKQVWNDYHDALKNMCEKQRKINLIRSGCGIFTMCAMPCCFLFGPAGYILTGIGIIGNIYTFVGLKNDNTMDEQERLTEEFQDQYICPNPQCNKFLGNISYKLMKRQYSMQCPYCKSKFVEK